MTAITPEAIAAAHAYDVAHRDDPGQPRRKQWLRPPGDQVARLLAGAAPHLAAAEQKRIYDLLGHDHFAVFTEDRWTVEHSVECRLSGQMHECEYHAAVAIVADDYHHRGHHGRWRVTDIDEDGEPVLVPADETGDTP